MNCCICGPVKNCGPYLNKVLENIEKIGNMFNNYTIIIYYDKSEDDSLEKLMKYKNKNQRLELFINNTPVSSYRTHNIANARNRILDRIRNKYSNFDYFIMMDFDDRCALDINLDVINKMLKRSDWDSVSFDHPTEGYYDFWALSIRPYVLSCHHFQNKLLGLNKIINLINSADKNSLIPCWSAFNGFAIYRTEKFLNCFYDGRFRHDYIPKKLIVENINYAGPIDNSVQKNEDCEHRHFHFQAILQNNARIRISPLQVFYL
jgi:hypothetical protein